MTRSAILWYNKRISIRSVKRSSFLPTPPGVSPAAQGAWFPTNSSVCVVREQMFAPRAKPQLQLPAPNGAGRVGGAPSRSELPTVPRVSHKKRLDIWLTSDWTPTLLSSQCKGGGFTAYSCLLYNIKRTLSSPIFHHQYYQ